MLFKQPDEFLLERHLLVMFLLVEIVLSIHFWRPLVENAMG